MSARVTVCEHNNCNLKVAMDGVIRIYTFYSRCHLLMTVNDSDSTGAVGKLQHGEPETTRIPFLLICSDRLGVSD